MRAVARAVFLCLGLLWWAGAAAQSPLSDNVDSIAVVIGNRDYKQTSAVDFAHNDAEAIKAWLIAALGFRERNIFLLKDATQGELNQMFGHESNPQGGRLWRAVTEGRSNVFVYYSGHGVPDLGTRQPFLLPQDGNPNVSESGYALQTLYRNLELVRQKIGSQRQLIVMIDACFTGETGRKGESLLTVSAPGFIPAKPRTGSGIVKLIATSGTTPANWDREVQLGLFTSRFLMAAAGLAKPGEAKSVSIADIRRYVTDTVIAAARRDSGREQVPEIDEASFALPIVRPVPAVAHLVAAARDENAWREASTSGQRSALEDYIASCSATCRYRDEAMGRLRELQRTALAVTDRQNWQRLSVAGNYADYLKGCGTVCAYRALAEDYLRQPRAESERSARKCDELAGYRDDQDRAPNVAVVAFDNLRADEAIAACRAAVEAQPHLRRLSFQLGRAYDKAKRYQEAASAYRKAMDAGSVAAMRNLGLLLENGEGVPKDEVEARRLYEKAAQAGSAVAMNSLGVMHARGSGVPKDDVEARRWYEKAVQAGSVAAMYNLGSMHERGRGGPVNLSEARRWYEKSAQAGDASAMNNLGSMLQLGQGGPKNVSEARRWYEKAAQAGSAVAKENLRGMQREKQSP